MEKSLSERIAIRERTKTASSKNKVLFLALRKDITEALENGWSVIAIGETLHSEGKITFTYNTFRLYISKFIEGNMNARIKRVVPDNRRNKLPDKQLSVKPATAIDPFIFNAKPNLDDLI